MERPAGPRAIEFGMPIAHNGCTARDMIIRRFLACAAFAAALPLAAAAQGVPAANFTDMWWNPAESGWGLSFVQHRGTHQAFAVWYTYDPREPDASGQYKPLWVVMSRGTWVSPHVITGPVYVLNGVPFSQPGSNRRITEVGSFTITFLDYHNAVFDYQIAPPANLAPDDPAYNLPALSGSKSITRQSF